MKGINILHIVIWKEGKFFVADCLEFGVASQGGSYKEAKKNIQEAIELYPEEIDGSEKNNIFLI
ncbi:MAG: type II toxin-antitoxin system HicB family antitoxin [Patescibacteria group bacterium]